MKKKRIVSVILSGSLLLSGCSSMLSRSVTTVTPHSATPAVESDKLTLRVEHYQELVNALLYFTAQGRENGTIRLYNYPYDVEQDMDDACREVMLEDPLGAYALAGITYDVTPIVSCYEAQVKLDFRRKPQQLASIHSVTGPTSIRSRLTTALTEYQSELVLRINHFEEDADYLRDLAWQAYLSSPETAMEFPQIELFLYPEEGDHRIAEFLFTYELTAQEMTAHQKALLDAQDQWLRELTDQPKEQALLTLCGQLRQQVEYSSEYGSTAYGALVEGKANSLGLVMAMTILSQKLGIPCQIVEGTSDGTSHAWMIAVTEQGPKHLAPAQQAGDFAFRSDEEMLQEGYQWDQSAHPPCP